MSLLSGITTPNSSLRHQKTLSSISLDLNRRVQHTLSHPTTVKMAKKGAHSLNQPSNWSYQLTESLSLVKSRTIAVRLVSMALTGYYKTLVRPRTHRPLSMLKYDPVGMFDLEFVRSGTLANSI